MLPPLIAPLSSVLVAGDFQGLLSVLDDRLVLVSAPALLAVGVGGVVRYVLVVFHVVKVGWLVGEGVI